MYILIISRGYPSEKYKMNGIFEFDQAKALAEAGHKVIYAAIDTRSFRRKRKWGFESLIKYGVQIEAINIPCGRIPKSILDRIRIVALRILYKKIESKYGKPDIIHAHFINSGYITAKVFDDSSIPLVLTEHYSAMNQKTLSSYYKRLGNYTYPRMSKVIAVSKYLANGLSQKFNIEPLIVPNIVDLSCFKYNDNKRKKQNDNFIIISVGRLIKSKRMDMLIEAFYHVFGSHKHIKLYIYGEGPERKYLEKMIKIYSLTDQIFLMGLASREEIAKRMSESNYFVLASQLETFGVAYIEAMAMGLPVIATRCGGPEDFVNNRNGILVPVDDVKALSNAMAYMYSNIDKYDKMFISTDIKNKYSPEIIANRLVETYRNLINKKVRKEFKY